MKIEVLTKTSDFKRVFSCGSRYFGRYVILYILLESEQQGNNSVGFIVRKSIGNAVKRNKIKRRVREIWRLKCNELLSGSKVIISARQEILRASYQEIEQELIRLIKRIV